MSQKNFRPLTCYNIDIHSLIMTIFGTSITEKVGNQNIFYFPTSSNLCFCTTQENRKPKNCVFSPKYCMLFTKNNTKHIKISLGYSCDGMGMCCKIKTLIGWRNVWSMKRRAPDQEVDHRGHGKRLCKKIAKHVIWTRRMLRIVVDGKSW